jgi:hypothetical protein
VRRDGRKARSDSSIRALLRHWDWLT